MNNTHFVLMPPNPRLACLGDELNSIEGVSAHSSKTSDEFSAHLADANALIIGNSAYTKEFAELIGAKAARLRWIQLTTAGYDNIARFGVPAGVLVSGAGDVRGNSVAEHAMALILSLKRQILSARDLQSMHRWDAELLERNLTSLQQETLVVVGYGAVGREVARKAKTFDMRVIAVNRTGKGSGPADEIVPSASLHEILPNADVLVLCAPLTNETSRLIGHRELALLPRKAVVINVARGELLDHDALLASIAEKDLTAALDVTDPEPLPADHPLWSCASVLITPHIGGQDDKVTLRLKRLFLDNVRRFCQGRLPVNLLDI